MMRVAGEIGQSHVLGGAAAEFSGKKELLQLFPPMSPTELPSLQRTSCALLQAWLRAGAGWVSFHTSLHPDKQFPRVFDR